MTHYGCGRHYLTLSLPLTVVLTSDTEDTSHREEQDLDSYRDVQIYIDVIAMLLAANVKNIDHETVIGRDVDIVQVIANISARISKIL